MLLTLWSWFQQFYNLFSHRLSPVAVSCPVFPGNPQLLLLFFLPVFLLLTCWKITLSCVSLQILLQQEDSPQDQREEVHLQVQLQQTRARQLPLHRHGLWYVHTHTNFCFAHIHTDMESWAPKGQTPKEAALNQRPCSWSYSWQGKSVELNTWKHLVHSRRSGVWSVFHGGGTCQTGARDFIGCLCV